MAGKEEGHLEVLIQVKLHYSTFASTKIKTISHTGTLGVLGVPITKYKITGKYNYTSSGATSALSTKGEVVYHYNPTIATDLTYYGGYINNKNITER
ncbi:hypothetical protein AB1L16_21195 [Peribacillus frigoritolerans]|uniref:hypothetical protein n=1 Tax=Peribacillus frigoritolerans TaxID=450367 RepID=UPI0039A3F327